MKGLRKKLGVFFSRENEKVLGWFFGTRQVYRGIVKKVWRNAWKIRKKV